MPIYDLLIRNELRYKPSSWTVQKWTAGWQVLLGLCGKMMDCNEL